MMRNPRLEEFEVESKPYRRTTKHTFSDFIYNEETGAILGRTPESWGKIIIFYIIFYAVLIALFAVCMATFLQHFINPRVPYLQEDEGLIGTSPGLGFRPRPPDVRSTLIWYKGTGYESYRYWEEELIDFLSVYKRKGQTAGAGQNIYNCGFGKPPPPPGKVCDVDIRGWEPCIEEDHFSFHKSSPCIFLKLNKIYGWRPWFFDPTDLPWDMPWDLQDHIRNITAYNRDYANTVWVSCAGETAADAESLGPLRYLPHRGFPGYYYPYENAEGYLSPLVAIHLQKPKTGILINVECRAWAMNIQYNRREKMGIVHFEIMIE